MKKKKSIGKTLLLVFGILITMICVWGISTGFRRETSAYVDDFAVNTDKSTIILHTGVASSMGFIRKVNIIENEEGEIRLDFIAAFGGLNGSIGAKDTYEIHMNEKTKSIFIYQGDKYRLILTKDSVTGEWLPVDWKPRSIQ